MIDIHVVYILLDAIELELNNIIELSSLVNYGEIYSI